MTDPTTVVRLPSPAPARLALLIDRLRPDEPSNTGEAEQRMQGEIARLAKQPTECALLRSDLLALLALDRPNLIFAEVGVQSTLGFVLELTQRISYRLLPKVPGSCDLADAFDTIFHHRQDALWINAVPDEDWLRLFDTLGLIDSTPDTKWLAALTLLNAARTLSYQIAGAGLDRELLRNEPALDRYESPFLAQNLEFMSQFTAARARGSLPETADANHLEVLFDQCSTVIQKVRRLAHQNGTSIRLTYLLARLEQLIGRTRQIFAVLFGATGDIEAVRLFKILVIAVKARHELTQFVGQNINLLARNVTENASQRGEHYIASSRSEWLGMFRAAAGGGAVIGVMAACKLLLAGLHLAPLTEGLVFGLNYAIGFSLIHVLGMVVATKQPAMTATTLASEFEGVRPREVDRLAGLVRNVASTQQIAIIGNLVLAAPVGYLIAWGWPRMFSAPFVSTAKAAGLMADLHPLTSGALGFAAVAGVGLFLAGLVSGWYDNRVRYQDLANRIAQLPPVRLLGSARQAAVASYIDKHYGAIMGNVFFGFYLGLVGNIGHLTGLPIDIRHVAFSGAYVGTALAVLDQATAWQVVPWAIAGTLAIGVVNLVVSFSLAFYVALRSRQQSLTLLPAIAWRVVTRYLTRPWSLLLPPRPEPRPAVSEDKGVAP